MPRMSVPHTVPIESLQIAVVYQEAVPLRIRDKATALRTLLDTPDFITLGKDHPRLVQHAEHVIKLALQGTAPNYDTVSGDIEHLSFLCRVENERCPGLNLRYLQNAFCNDTREFDLAEITQELERGVGRYRFIVTPDEENFPHHVLIDIQKHEGTVPISAVIFESLGGGTYVKPILHAFRNKNVPVVTILNGVQRSSVDCIMFALAHALKAFDSSYVRNLHHAMWRNQTALQASPIRKGVYNKVIAHGAVPAIFKKHMQSKSDLWKLPSQASQRVNSTKHAYPETLALRFEQFYARHKPTLSYVEHTFSASLQGFRLKELSRTIKYLQTQSSEDVRPQKRLRI